MLKAGDIGLDLAGAGRVPRFAHVDSVQRIRSKREEAKRIIAEQNAILLQVLFTFYMLLPDGF